jgi:hypothetical protein
MCKVIVYRDREMEGCTRDDWESREETGSERGRRSPKRGGSGSDYEDFQRRIAIWPR